MAMNFFPGIAQDLLDAMSVRERKPKAEILRGLIRDYPASDDEPMRKAYSVYTQLGKELKALEGKNDSGAIRDLADKALKKAKALMPDLIAAPMEARNLERIKCALGSQMKFRPMDQEDKLKLLAEQSGLSMQAVLRALILGTKLPNSQALRTFGRMIQIGGLFKYLSSMTRDWEIFGKGCELQKLASRGLMREHGRRLEARGYSS